MNILKKRGTAVAVLLVAILLFSPLGIYLSVAREARRVERCFTDGVYLSEEKRTVPSIAHHLENCLNASTGLLSLISDDPRMEDSVKRLGDARLGLIRVMDSEDIPAIAEANRVLSEAVEALRPELGNLSGTKADNAEYYLDLFSGAESAIEANPYHDLANSFGERVLDAFPTSLFRLVLRFPTPASF